MAYDPRTIAFGAEILHQPIRLEAPAVQGIHNSLYREHEIGYQNFQVAQDGIHLSNPPQVPGGISAASYLPDRLVLREEFRPCTVEEFATRVVNVSSLSYRALSVPLSVGQQFWVRSLVNTQHFTDSRAFVADAMIAGGHERMECFRRPLFTAGLRYAFTQTDTAPGTLNLRIEPWPQDPRSVWIEVVGQFTQPIPTEGLPQVSNYLYSVYRFVTGPVLEYIGEFDRP